ncbi:uncharacterized protein V6R79_001955 [Siganus canaliculatus]
MQHQQGAHAQEPGLLGTLGPGKKKLDGKTFYLDSVKKRSTALLLEAISLLGGRVESFLHKDVNFVVTGSQECLKGQKSPDTKTGAKGRSEDARSPIMTRENVLRNDRLRPGTPRPVACGSRGKALLEKAISNNERLKKNSVLANARSWGVKILFVNDVLLYLKQLTHESFSPMQKKPEKTYNKHQGSTVVKAAALRSPYLKIEDCSRKYKPLHMQSMTFPSLWYLGRYSPFESPPPPQFQKSTEQEKETRKKRRLESSDEDKSLTPLGCNPSPWRPRKKDLSYCECCRQTFTHLEEHLQSEEHRAFVLDLSNYATVDQLVAEMFPGFNLNPPQLEETLNQSPSPSPIQDICELEPLSDAETERAVQALHRQGSSFNAPSSSPVRPSLSCGPASPSPEAQPPNPNPDTPPANNQPPTAATDLHILSSQPPPLSPALPVLETELQTQDSGSDVQHLSPCPTMPCLSPDPYSLPPVLSPQVPYHPYALEPRSPYSEPPVLSPQQHTAEEAVEGHKCETDVAESVLQCVSPQFSPVKAEQRSNPVFGFSEITNSAGGSSTTLLSCRSRSLPRPPATALNPRKRCRSASPDHTRSRRKRMRGNFDQGRTESVKPECDSVVKPEECSSSHLVFCPPHKISSTHTEETMDLKQTLTMLCAPTVQNHTQLPNPGDSLSCGFSHKSHSVLSSQDSQRSVSLSTSVCIDSALIPDLNTLSPSSSDSDWDCDLLSRLAPSSTTTTAAVVPPAPAGQSCELDKELLHRPCTWMQDANYESRLHTVLQPPTSAASLFVEEMDASAFSRTVVQVVQVQH